MGLRPCVPVLAAVLVLSLLLVPTPSAAAPSVNAAGTITSFISDSGLDTDGDGLFNYLVVNVTVSVTVQGAFYLSLAPRASSPAIEAFAVGSHTMEIRVAGWDLYAQGVDGPYTFYLTLRDADTYATLDSAYYTTSAYAATDFDPPAAVVEAYDAPYAVDTNGNGLYDELRMNYTLNVTSTEPYDTSLAVGGWSGGTHISTFFTDTAAVGVGVHDLVFVYPGAIIREMQISGIYDVQLYVCQYIIGPYFRSCWTTGIWNSQTPDYNWTEFDVGPVRMAPPFSDRGVDVDGDGLYEAISVHVPIHLDVPANVTLLGYLGGFYERWSTAMAFETLGAGDASIDLLLPAFVLRERGLSGRYAVDLYLSVDLLGGYQTHESYQTANYSSNEFSPPAVSVSGVFWTPVDADADGAYDFLDAGINLTARKDGLYFVHGFLDQGTYPTIDLEAGRLLRLAAGTTTIVPLRYSGVAINRGTIDGPWGLSFTVEHVSGLSGDFVSGSAWSPALNRSHFVSLPTRHLTGAVWAASGAFPISGSMVLAADPSRAFWTFGMVASNGTYDLEVYDGNFTVNAGYYGPAQPESHAVVVSGATAERFNLSYPPEARIDWDATVDSWNRTSVSTETTWAYANSTVRIAADVFGNFDGVADASELGSWMASPFSVPYASISLYPVAMGLKVRVDGQNLDGVVGTSVATQGAGSYLAKEPIVGLANSTFVLPTAPSAGPDHTIGLTLYYDSDPILDTNLTLHLPAGTTSTATASPNVALYHPDATTWIVDPGQRPVASDLATATLTVSPAAVPDTTPPVAAFAADTAERGVPETFDASGSTDDVGVVNETWNMTVNGTARMGYGMTFEASFAEIGTYTVTLTVRDAAGNTGTVSHAVVVRDTTPPPAVTGVSAVAGQTSAGVVVDIHWTPVTTDDLAGYRVYESTDGTTFALARTVPADTTGCNEYLPSGVESRWYRVAAVDRYGNEGTPSAPVRAVVPHELGPSPSPLNVGLWLVAVVVIAVAAVATVLVLRSRRKKEPPTEPERVT